MYPLQLTLLFLTVCAHNLTPKLNTLFAPALRHYAHTHTPRSNHVMTLTHPPLGDVKHQEEVSQGRHLPGVFILFYFIYFFVSGRDVRGKLREWVSTEHHEPGKQKVVGETSSDVCVCILMENSFRRDTHV